MRIEKVLKRPIVKGPHNQRQGTHPRLTPLTVIFFASSNGGHGQQSWLKLDS